MSLEGRHVLVTGGSRGIGAACCRLFAEAGATVCVHFNTAADDAAVVLDGLAAGEGGNRHFAVAADLGSEAGVRELFDRIGSEWGRLDCLVNNAGIWVRNPLDSLDAGKLQQTWRINVDGPIRCAERASPLLRKAEDGNIVNLGSTAGQRGEADYSPYAASKGAIHALTKSWSTELAPEVRVNAVAPGWVDTDMSAPAYRERGREAIEAAIPVGRVATAEDIAAPVLFLASPAARHITGEILNVNGGSVLCG